MKKMLTFLCAFLLASVCFAEAKKKSVPPIKYTDLSFQKFLEDDKDKLGNIPEIIKGEWINKSTGTEFEEKIAEFEKINSIAADVFFGSLIASDRKQGHAEVDADFWKGLNEEEKAFGFDLLSFFKNHNRLPIFYSASLKKEIAKYEADKLKADTEYEAELKEATVSSAAVVNHNYFFEKKPDYSYLLLAIQYACNSEKEKAQKIIAGLNETDLNNFNVGGIIKYIDKGHSYLKEQQERILQSKLNSEYLERCFRDDTEVSDFSDRQGNLKGINPTQNPYYLYRLGPMTVIQKLEGGYFLQAYNGMVIFLSTDKEFPMGHKFHAGRNLNREWYGSYVYYMGPYEYTALDGYTHTVYSFKLVEE